MYRNVPECLAGQVIFSDVWWVQRARKRNPRLLLLTRDLMFYELQNGKLINKLDLKSTCLAKIAKQLLDYNGPDNKFNGTTMRTKGAIHFGKYISMGLPVQHFYILVHCWDKLIVLERMCNSNVVTNEETSSSHYVIKAEYEDVSEFKLIQSNIKFEAIVEITFHHKVSVITDFQDATEEESQQQQQQHQQRVASATAVVAKEQRHEFRRMLSRLRSAQAELHTHKALTQRKFDCLRDEQRFGNTYMRSLHLEEKDKLTRCGDIWLRITAHNWLVIGVPLANNGCSNPLHNITLQNIRPILGVGEETTTTALNYYHKFYRRQPDAAEGSKFESDELMDATDDSNTWESISEEHMLPETLFVLLIKIELCHLLTLTKCPLVLMYTLRIGAMDLPSTGENAAVRREFQQQMYLKMIDITEILKSPQHLEITGNQTFSQKDLLSIIFTTVELDVCLRYHSLDDLNRFRQFLTSKCDFVIQTENAAEKRTIDDGKDAMKTNQFYNSNGYSCWFGCFIHETLENNTNNNTNNNNNNNSKDTSFNSNDVDMNAFATAQSDFNMLLKCYGPNEERLQLLLKFITNELISFNSSGITIVHSSLAPPSAAHKNTFCNALQQELHCLMQMHKKNANSVRSVETSSCEELLKFELQTDLMRQMSLIS